MVTMPVRELAIECFCWVQSSKCAEDRVFAPTPEMRRALSTHAAQLVAPFVPFVGPRQPRDRQRCIGRNRWAERHNPEQPGTKTAPLRRLQCCANKTLADTTVPALRMLVPSEISMRKGSMMHPKFHNWEATQVGKQAQRCLLTLDS
jgi:hypothetical protein